MGKNELFEYQLLAEKAEQYQVRKTSSLFHNLVVRRHELTEETHVFQCGMERLGSK